MKIKFLLPVTVFCTTVLPAQELTLRETISNPKEEVKKGKFRHAINNGVISLEAEGGRTPYTYKWSNQETPLDSFTAEGLTEGRSYTVTVTDTDGLTGSGTYTVPAEAIPEVLNSRMVPVVNALEQVFFWDPFAAMGLRDPVMYAEHENVPVPGWEPEADQSYTLKSWLEPDKSRVEEGDPIALVAENGQEFPVFATTSGELRHLVGEGGVIYDSDNKYHKIQAGAHYLARIKYDSPRAILHPNGDKQTRGIPFIVVWLVIGATFFTLRMGFINIRGFRHSIQLARGKYSDPAAPGQTTHFQALSTAVSGTVGLGNIAGVAVAISIGGAGATFWMILAGLLGMSSKFVECTLGVKYREINKEGRVFGGSMSYLTHGLKKRKLGGLGKVLAVLFAVLCVGASFGGGNMFQANQSFEQVASQFTFLQGRGFWFGVITAILVGIVIIGGIKSIAKVTSRVVPFMASLYILAALAVIFINIDNVGNALMAIVNGAFSPDALKGGVVGVLIVGFQRAAFSNEAGVGSASIAHSTAKTHHPPAEGIVALMEPFIDTVVVCTLTALVLIFTGMHEVSGMAGASLTSSAFGSVISWFPYVLAVAVFLFAFSTMISWSYYGVRAWTYLFGKSRRTELVYKFLFLGFVVLGASVGLGAVLDFSDMMILAMAFPNMIGLYLMSGEVRKDLNAYLKKLKEGKLFKKSEVRSEK